MDRGLAHLSRVNNGPKWAQARRKKSKRRPGNRADQRGLLGGCEGRRPSRPSGTAGVSREGAERSREQRIRAGGRLRRPRILSVRRRSRSGPDPGACTLASRISLRWVMSSLDRGARRSSSRMLGCPIMSCPDRGAGEAELRLWRRRGSCSRAYGGGAKLRLGCRRGSCGEHVGVARIGKHVRLAVQ